MPSTAHAPSNLIQVERVAELRAQVQALLDADAGENEPFSGSADDWGAALAALSTKVLPVAMARGAIQPWGIMAGKFQGAIPANTPIGSRYWVVS